MICLYSNTHVDIAKLAHKVIHPTRVGRWHVDGGERGSLDYHVVNGDLGARVLIKLGSQS